MQRINIKVRQKSENSFEASTFLDGKRIYRNAKTQVEAKAKIRKAVEDYQNGKTISRSAKLCDAMEQYLKNVKSIKVKATTYDRVESTFKYHIRDEKIGRMQVGQITTQDIQDHLTAQCKAGLSFSSIKKIYNLLGEFFRYEIATKEIYFNPMLLVTMPHASNIQHTEKDIAIINYENQDAIDVSKNILSQKYYFSSRNNKVQAYFDNEAIYLNDVLVLHKDDIKLQGIHNYENIMAALLVCSNFNLDINKIKDFLKTFGGVEHRLEFVRNYNGVDFYNDSKSTNPTSTITALKTFNKPIHLILGGLNRNQDYHELDEYITHVKYIYAIGEVTDNVFEYAKSMNIPCYKGYTLDEAMRFLKQNIKSGEVVLLSPGASSQDQYLHFEDRGIEFKNIVEKY